MSGKQGEDLIIRVPPGTLVRTRKVGVLEGHEAGETNYC